MQINTFEVQWHKGHLVQKISPIVAELLPVFTALHGMQTRSSDEISVCPSVRLSVCLSVCQTRAL